MADAAIEFLLNNLKDLLTYHASLITEAKGNIESLEKHLRIFKAFLRDTVNIRKRSDVAKEMVKEIHEVVYEVEDIIEVFVTNTVHKRSKNFFTRFWETSVSLHSIGKKVEEIKGRVEQCRQDLSIISLDDGQPEKPEVRPPRKKDVVGFEDVTEHLIGRLLQETDYFDVISIIGMLGLGKTTVAWKIFTDPRIVYNFPVRIWLPISQQFTDKEIFIEILKQIATISDDLRSKPDHELCELVRDRLRGGFLIVMDDVWKRADWDRLRAALPDHNQGKILITSREETVGTYASSPRPLYSLRFFKPEESWKLFRLEALHKMECPPELEDIGREISKNCKGLPLAIVIIGGILATKFLPRNLTATRRDWEEVAPRVYSYLDENDPGKRMQKLIYLSYDNLPYHLRACFLYLGMFPEDYEIPVSKLILMWIGEGFVQQNNHRSLEVTAQDYLADLIHRNLVKSEKFKNDGKVKTCRIHDTLRDFCRNEAADANFLQGITYNSEGQLVPSASDIPKYRRLFIHSNCSNFISLKPFGPRVRSFVSFPKDKSSLSPEEGANIIKAFQLVRIFDVLAFKFATIDSDLYKLVHMRYIALSFNLSILPARFNNLWNLQTLIVDTTSRTLQVKADLWQMKRLRHFKTNASATLPTESSVSDELSGAELQTVGSISVESCTEKLIGRACNLKKLGIRGKLAVLFDTKNGSFDSLGKMKKLWKLKLINDVHPQLPRDGGIKCLPEPHRFPSSLTSLTLCATYLSWGQMSILGLLKTLEVLKLKDNAFTGSKWESVDGGFRCLEILHIEDTDLTVWTTSSKHYPKLRGLVLKNCEALLQIPNEVADIPTLQMLDLHTCISAAQSAKKISDVKKQAGDSEFLLSIYPPVEL